MTPNLPDVRPGDAILPAFQAVVRYDRAQQLESGRNLRKRVMPFGTSYSADQAAALWTHPWKVGLNGTEATVRAGAVQDVVPMIDGVLLTDANQPKLKIEDGPNEEGESWIALVVTVIPESGLIDIEAEEPAKIVHTNDWQSLETETAGVLLLALLVWTNDAITSVIQNATMPLRYAYREKNGTKPFRHFFFAT